MEIAINLIQDETIDQIAVVFCDLGCGLRDVQLLHHFGCWALDRCPTNDRRDSHYRHVQSLKSLTGIGDGQQRINRYKRIGWADDDALETGQKTADGWIQLSLASTLKLEATDLGSTPIANA